MFATASIAPFIKALRAGMGRHVNFLAPQQLIRVGLWAYIAQYIVAVSSTFVRLSVAFLLMRIFGTNRYWRWGLKLAISFIIATNVSILVFALLECRPIQRSWNPMLNGSCWPDAGKRAFTTYQGGKIDFSIDGRPSRPLTELLFSCWDVLRLGFGNITNCRLMEFPA